MWKKGKEKVVWGAFFIGLVLELSVFSLSGVQETRASMKDEQKRQRVKSNSSPVKQSDDSAEQEDDWPDECHPMLRASFEYLRTQKDWKEWVKEKKKEMKENKKKRELIKAAILNFLRSSRDTEKNSESEKV